MADLSTDRLLRLLAEEEPPIRPAFADSLRERLAADLGFGPVPRGYWLLGLRRAVAPGALRSVSPELRLAYLVALLALLAALIFGLLTVGSRFGRRDPADLVRLSQGDYDHPPAFAETFRDWTGALHRLESDGAGTWRIDEVAADGTLTGSYDLYDGSQGGHYDATGQVWTSGTVAEMYGGVPPGPLSMEFAWARLEAVAGSKPRLVRVTCDAPQLLEDAVVAGRAADHVRCPATDMQVWLDRESHLILRIEAGPDTPHWNPGAAYEATSLTLNPPVDPAAYSFAGPPGAYGPADQPLSHTLVAGDLMPDLTGPLLDGGTFHSTSLAGQPAAILVWTTGVNAPYLRVFAAAVGRLADRLGAAVVSMDDPTTTAAAMADVGFTGPTVLAAGGVIDPLGLNAFPVLVLVGADGTIRSLSHQVDDAAELDAMLGAIISGTPIPAPTWASGAAGDPGPSTRLVVGQLAPEWTLSLDAGRSIGTRDFPGMRTIVYWGMPQGGDDYDADNTALLKALMDAQRGAPTAIRVVIVDARPYTVDQAQAALRSSGVDLQVVPDRDGVVGHSWGLAYYPSLVLLDGTGRVAWYGAGACIDTPPLLQAFVTAGPMPSPALVQSAPGCP